jgi:DNA mismatch repair ATPase MutS
MRYLDIESSIRFAPHSLRIKYRSPEATMMIDLSAIASLELIQNLRQAKSKECLFGFLNQTQTGMGTRMLRASILQPFTQTDDILPRYDTLEELSTNEDMFHEIRKGQDTPCILLRQHHVRVADSYSSCGLRRCREAFDQGWHSCPCGTSREKTQSD